MELKLKSTTALIGSQILGLLPIVGQLIVTIDLAPQNHLKTDEVIYVELDCTKK
jgi:hypothetical protein